jgi:hypothetical protein
MVVHESSSSTSQRYTSVSEFGVLACWSNARRRFTPIRTSNSTCGRAVALHPRRTWRKATSARQSCFGRIQGVLHAHNARHGQHVTAEVNDGNSHAVLVKANECDDEERSAGPMGHSRNRLIMRSRAKQPRTGAGVS